MAWNAPEQVMRMWIQMNWRERQRVVQQPLVRELMEKALDDSFLVGLDEEEWDFRPSRHEKIGRWHLKESKTLWMRVIDGWSDGKRGIYKFDGDMIRHFDDVDDGELVLVGLKSPARTRARMGKQKEGAKGPPMRVPQGKQMWALLERKGGERARFFGDVKREHVIEGYRVLHQSKVYDEVRDFALGVLNERGLLES